MMRALLSVGDACNNACTFCGQSSLPARDQPGPPVAELRQRLAQLRSDADEVSIVGGEPTLRADLADIVAAAKSAGFARIGLQTNARELSATRLDSLVTAGLTDVQLSLHGATAPVHEYHTGSEGSFDAVMRAARDVKAKGLAVAVSTVLTRSNFRVLAALPDLLARRWIDGWCLWVPHARGRAEQQYDRVVPRLGLALPFALHAIRRAETLGLPAYIAGAPLCTLGPMGDRALPSGERAYHDLCGACPSRSRCPGVDAHYLARFDGDELRPVEAPPAAERHPDIQRLFVGPGRLAAASSLQIPEAPGAARAHLPVLGKSRPAVAEARRADRQTGEALGALFPALFEEGEA